MDFDLLVARFHITASRPLAMPEFAGNRIRGLLGAGLHHILPESEYARWFAPEGSGGPSGLHNQPRPFVLRAWHLNGRNIAAGESFAFDVHFFSNEEPLPKAFAEAARALGRVDQMEVRAVSIPLDAEPLPPATVHLQFLTPTELKAGGRLVERPEFGALLSRLRDRISTLGSLYGHGALAVDFGAFGRRAAEVRLTAWQGEWVDHRRNSKHTGETHPLGGFAGTAVYQEVPAEFLPFLDAGFYTGVGRQTTWGKGVIQRTMLEV